MRSMPSTCLHGSGTEIWTVEDSSGKAGKEIAGGLTKADIASWTAEEPGIYSVAAENPHPGHGNA